MVAALFLIMLSVINSTDSSLQLDQASIVSIVIGSVATVILLLQGITEVIIDARNNQAEIESYETKEAVTSDNTTMAIIQSLMDTCPLINHVSLIDANDCCVSYSFEKDVGLSLKSTEVMQIYFDSTRRNSSAEQLMLQPVESANLQANQFRYPSTELVGSMLDNNGQLWIIQFAAGEERVKKDTKWIKFLIHMI